MFNQPIEEYSSSGQSSNSEAGRMQLHGSQDVQDHHHLQQSHHHHHQQDFKNHRNVRKIEGPIIPTEYSDPDLQRQSSEFSAILQQATNNVAAKRHESTFVMDISPSVVGWIIGRSGIRIKEIQSYTGCKMWVDQDVPNDQPRKIYFHGNKQNIDAAVGRVNELVQAAPILSSNHVVSGKGLTSVIVDCPVSLVGLLIGKRGWTIKKIQQASNAQISINQSVREGLPRKIIVSGDEQSVSTALKLITEVLRDKTLVGGGGGDHEGGHQLTMRMVNGNSYPTNEPGNSSPSGPMRESFHDQTSSHGGGGGSGRYSPQPPHHFQGQGQGSRSNGGAGSPISSDMESKSHRDVDRYHPGPQPHEMQSQGYPYASSSVPNYNQIQRHQSHSQHRNGQYYQDQAQTKRGYSNGSVHQHSQHPQPQQPHHPYGGYHQESARGLYMNQYVHQPHATPFPSKYVNGHSDGMMYYGGQREGHNYGGEYHHHQYPQPHPMSDAEYNKYRQQATSNSSQTSGESSPSNSNASIFDFQHRQSPANGAPDSRPPERESQQEGGDGAQRSENQNDSVEKKLPS